MKTSFCPDEYISKLSSRISPSPFSAVTTADEAEETSAHLRGALMSCLGVERIPGKTGTTEYTELERHTFDGILKQKLSLEICEGLSMSVMLLTPPADRCNGSNAVALSGHGYGARQITRTAKSGRNRTLPFLDNYQDDFALKLARRGCIVAVPELIGFGEARLKKDLRKPFYSSSCDTLTKHLNIFGLTTAGMRVYQAMSCIDLLHSIPGCEQDRTSVMGISGGGLTALYTAALDMRVRRTVVSGYLNTAADSILARWHCPDNYIPYLLTYGDIYDFACTIAPRELLTESGTRDPLFRIAGSKRAIEQTERIYSLLGAEGNYSYDVFDGKHRISGRKAYDFIVR